MEKLSAISREKAVARWEKGLRRLLDEGSSRTKSKRLVSEEAQRRIIDSLSDDWERAWTYAVS